MGATMKDSELLKQHEQSRQILMQTINYSETQKALNKSYCFITDISLCAQMIKEKREAKLFDLAIKEYQFSLFTLSQGMYRHAFSSLRLTLELALSAIEFSANEYSLRRWESGLNDINWQRIINLENGIFSKNFANIFNVEVADRIEHYRKLAESVYRECSEYVHGNANTHLKLPSKIEFSEENVLSWADKSSTIHMIILFTYFLRYVGDLNAESKEQLSLTFNESLGHIPSIRITFGGQK